MKSSIPTYTGPFTRGREVFETIIEELASKGITSRITAYDTENLIIHLVIDFQPVDLQSARTFIDKTLSTVGGFVNWDAPDPEWDNTFQFNFTPAHRGVTYRSFVADDSWSQHEGKVVFTMTE